VNPLATAEKEIRALARRLGIRSHLVRAALESISEDDPVPAKLAKATRAARPATANDMGQAARVEKFTYVRSRPLCKAFRLIPCQNCSAQDGSVVGAHSNWSCHGKGRSIKASDIYQASLCFTCHSMLDQGSRLLERERKLMWWNAHTKSVPLLISQGHWPDNIEPPNTTDWPF
jgi:hypothetical protein